jgi:hypothetical protein
MTTDPTLLELLALFDERLHALGFTRRRGGIASGGVAWAEAAGRIHGSFFELRFHHRPSQRLVQAGLLEYQSLSDGGRTIPIGDSTHHYVDDPREAIGFTEVAVLGWLAAMERASASAS